MKLPNPFKSLLRKIKLRHDLNVGRKILEMQKPRWRHNGHGEWTTPDAPLIEAKDAHLVFLYDCKEWRSIKDLLSGFVGRAFTDINVEAFVSKKTGRVIAFPSHNGAKPVWSDCQRNNPGCPIRGELWLVPSKTIFELDRFYGNRVQYMRTEIPCTGWRHKSYFSETHNRTHVTSDVPRPMKAWIYLGVPEEWDIDAGYNWEPLRIRHSKNKEPHAFYYHSYRSDPLRHPS